MPRRTEPDPASEPAPGCVVCRAPGSRHFMEVRGRSYRRCVHCEATFLEPRQLPTPDDEYAHYLLHENDPMDPRYRRFLSKLSEPLLARLPTGSYGLDYGCGPGPALAAMLRDHGHTVELFDPFFNNDPSVLARAYDFVTCTEVAEHFHHPADELDRLGALLRPGGWLAIMTCFQTDDSAFASWHYRLDPTHVVFYRESTMRCIARQRRWQCDIPRKDVALMRTP